MTENNGFDTKYKDEMICPYCGYPQDHAITWDITIERERGDASCRLCGEMFDWQEHANFTYSTRKQG